MQQDRVGWHFAPAGTQWCCPECQIRSAIDDWSRCTIIDQSDAAEDARLCPECGSIISATSSASIEGVADRSSTFVAVENSSHQP